MAGMPFTNRPWPIAMDLGTESIRMLQLGCAGDVVRAVACGRWAFPDAVGDDPAARRDAAVEAVRLMLKRNGFKGRQVITSLPCDLLNIKNIRLPAMPPDQLDRAVREEAAERFEFPLFENQLNYFVAGSVRSGNDVRNEVVLLGVPEETISDHVAMIADMGLHPEHIEAEPIALFRNQLRYLQRQSDKEAVTVVIDIGARGACVVVGRGRGPVFIKFIDIGGRRMTEAVAKQLNLSYQDARQMRQRAAKMRKKSGERREDDGPDLEDRTSLVWTIRDAIRGEVESLCREISLCLRYCSVTFRGLRPDAVTLMGGQACDQLCVEMVRENLNMECTVCQPLRNVDLSGVDFGDDRRSMMTDWSLCAGLACHWADFAQDRQKKHGSQRRLSA